MNFYFTVVFLRPLRKIGSVIIIRNDFDFCCKITLYQLYLFDVLGKFFYEFGN